MVSKNKKGKFTKKIIQKNCISHRIDLQGTINYIEVDIKMFSSIWKTSLPAALLPLQIFILFWVNFIKLDQLPPLVNSLLDRNFNFRVNWLYWLKVFSNYFSKFVYFNKLNTPLSRRTHHGIFNFCCMILIQLNYVIIICGFACENCRNIFWTLMKKQMEGLTINL